MSRKEIINILIIGGCGFVGNKLLEYYANTPNSDELYKIWSLDNFSSSTTHPIYEEFSKNQHLVQIKSLKYENVFYIKGNSWDIFEECRHITPSIIFHFGEFSRINQSWYEIDTVMKSNLYGTSKVLDYAVKNKSLLVYSASSAIFGDNAQNATPYTWTKSKMVELITNYENWFGLQSVITYFYNVYGPGQIMEGSYATVMGIFEKQTLENKPCTVVLPGTQKRCFTHINDIISGIVLAVSYKMYNIKVGITSCNGDIKHVPIFSNDEFTIEEVAKMFQSNIEYLPERKGDRKESVKILDDVLRTKFKWNTTFKLKEYIQHFKVKNNLI